MGPGTSLDAKHVTSFDCQIELENEAFVLLQMWKLRFGGSSSTLGSVCLIGGGLGPLGSECTSLQSRDYTVGHRPPVPLL